MKRGKKREGEGRREKRGNLLNAKPRFGEHVTRGEHVLHSTPDGTRIDSSGHRLDDYACTECTALAPHPLHWLQAACHARHT